MAVMRVVRRAGGFDGRLGLAHHALELVVDLGLDAAQLFLEAAALLEQGGELFVDALERRHAAVGALEEREGGRRLAGGLAGLAAGVAEALPRVTRGSGRDRLL